MFYRALNYAKLVDPYPPVKTLCCFYQNSRITDNNKNEIFFQGYGTILGDEPPRIKRVMGGCMGPIQVCLPTFACPHPINYGRHNPGQQPCIVNVPRDCAKECPKIICEPCPPPPPTKVWLIKSSPMPQKVGLSNLLLFLLVTFLLLSHQD